MSSGRWTAARLPRAVHPVAWWAWALGLAVAASRTTNPLLLGLILTVAGVVVAARRTDAPWARAFRSYLLLGLLVVAIRVAFRIVLGGGTGDERVLVHLPEVPLPGWMAGVSLGGPVSLDSVLAATYDGLRLATLLCCIGAANTLANPKRALRSLPAALYELGVGITVAMTVAPQLVESAQRVRRARRLRGVPGSRRRVVRGIAMPVLHDALARSFQLAAAMDARGYGRRGDVAPRVRRRVVALQLLALLGLCVGLFGVLDATMPRALGLPLLGAGVVAGIAGVALGGRGVHRTRYRPDPWTLVEWATFACGVAAAVAMIAAGHRQPGVIDPSVSPPVWPSLSLLAVAGLGIAALPAWFTPVPEAAADGRRALPATPAPSYARS